MNGILIPELVVTRGSEYTFIVEGGTDENSLNRYHPFYITDSINGGRLQNSQELRDVCMCALCVHVHCVYACVYVHVCMCMCVYVHVCVCELMYTDIIVSV